MTGERGRLLVVHTTFSNNTAWLTGGAISVTDRKHVTMFNCTLLHNVLTLHRHAVGGGFYCFMCSSINITTCMFASNMAAYGGGAAIIKPWRLTVIYNTSFIANIATPNMSDGRVMASHQRHLLGARAPIATVLAGESTDSGQFDATAILGPVAANVIGDDGHYTGGGGMYLSLRNVSILQDCAFLSNLAAAGGMDYKYTPHKNCLGNICGTCLFGTTNKQTCLKSINAPHTISNSHIPLAMHPFLRRVTATGGLLARTDACKRMPQEAAKSCVLRLSKVSMLNNKAIITDIRPEVVHLNNCKYGTVLSRATIACLAGRNALVDQLGKSPWSVLSGSLLNSSRNNLSANHELVLTSAAAFKCQRLHEADAQRELWVGEACSRPIQALAGRPFGCAFVLLDGFGNQITSGIHDSDMSMVVSIEPL